MYVAGNGNEKKGGFKMEDENIMDVVKIEGDSVTFDNDAFDDMMDDFLEEDWF